jgi:hypothetical protein
VSRHCVLERAKLVEHRAQRWWEYAPINEGWKLLDAMHRIVVLRAWARDSVSVAARGGVSPNKSKMCIERYTTSMETGCGESYFSYRSASRERLRAREDRPSR